MRRFFSIIGALLLASSMFAQGELYDQPVVLFAKQQYGGLLINTNGFGLNFTLANYKGAYKLHIWNWDFVAIKHEKELKYPGQDPTAKGYFYGKQNSFYALRFGWGTKKTLAEKLRKNGVQLGYSWQIGPELGLLKPIYLEIVHTDPGLGSAGRYTLVERYDPEIHFAENIYGRASGFRGLSELKAVPGVFAKFAWQFEYSNFNEGLKGIEAGITVDAFPYRVPIMAPKILEQKNTNAKNHMVFVSLYLNFFIGKKYNKS